MSEETQSARDDETVILARMQDAVEAGALRELLESEGISVATPGLTHRSLLGMAGGYVEIVVRVPGKDLARAKELYEGFRATSPAGETEGAAHPRDDDTVRTDRLRRVAVFAAVCLTFGSGHFYARRWRAGFVLAVTELACLGLAYAWPLYWYAIPLIVAADVLGSVGAIGADQRGARATMLVALAPLLGLAALALVPLVRVAMPGVLAGRDMVAACTRAAECESDESVDACIDRAAERVFSGHLPGDRARACAECLDESLCEDVRYDCAECDGLVQLPSPAAPVDRTPGPLGTSADDMQLVVPSLFRSDDPEGMPPEELDELLRALEQRPPTR